jgi:hypothetical protein
MIIFGGLVAQLVEQCPFKALVQGSSPCQPTSLRSPIRYEPRFGEPERRENEGGRAVARCARRAKTSDLF